MSRGVFARRMRPVHCLCLLLLATSVDASELRIVLRDAQTLLPTSARVQLRVDSQWWFAAPDSTIPTRTVSPLGPYVHVEDELEVDVPDGFVEIFAVRGLTGMPVQAAFVLSGDREVVLDLDDWVDPAVEGWFSVEPHLHGSHAEGSVYPGPTPEQLVRMARAEGLDLVHVLDNVDASPRGRILPQVLDVALEWGEEYRADFWGHLVLHGLDALVYGDGYPGCCSAGNPPWPTLNETLSISEPPLSILAHPRTTEDPSVSLWWPGSGYAREAGALVLTDRVDGVAVAGGTIAPDGWDLESYLDGLRSGARWAAVGEGDRALDRYEVGPPGEVRTFVQLGNGRSPADPDFAAAWREAVRLGRSVASTGPLVRALEVNELGIGSTVSLAGPTTVSVRIAFESLGLCQTLVLHGATGEHLRWEWEPGRASLDTTIALAIEHDDFFVLDVSGDGSDWPQSLLAPRAVTSAVQVEMGTPWSVPGDVARRGADQLLRFWDDLLDDRDFSSEAESVLVHTQIYDAIATYEGMHDDPPRAFVLRSPLDGAQILTQQFAVSWSPSVSYDDEPVTYRVEFAPTDRFLDVQHSFAATDTSLVVGGLAADRVWFWRVWAQEPGEPARLADDGPWSVVIDPDPVAVGERDSSYQLRTSEVDGGYRFDFRVPREGRIDAAVFDVRGRKVAAWSSRVDAQESASWIWYGRDTAGSTTARGVYWIRAAFDGEVRVERMVRAQ